MQSTLNSVSFGSILKWKCLIQLFFKFFSSTEVSKSVKHFESLLGLENVLVGNPTLMRLQRQNSKSVINTSVRERRPRLWNVTISLSQFWLITLKSSNCCFSHFHPRERWQSLPSTSPSEGERSHNPVCSPFPFPAGQRMQGAEQGQRERKEGLLLVKGVWSR